MGEKKKKGGQINLGSLSSEPFKMLPGYGSQSAQLATLKNAGSVQQEMIAHHGGESFSPDFPIFNAGAYTPTESALAGNNLRMSAIVAGSLDGDVHKTVGGYKKTKSNKKTNRKTKNRKTKNRKTKTRKTKNRKTKTRKTKTRKTKTRKTKTRKTKNRKTKNVKK